MCDISGKTEPAGAVTRRCSQRVSTRLLEELKTEATLSSTAKRPYDAVSKDLRIMDKKRTGGGIDNKKAKFKHDGKTKDNTPFVGSTASSTVGSEGAEEVLKRKKIWLDQGLYVGQEEKRLKPTFGAKKLKNKQRTKAHALPLPIFAGQQILNTERDFKLPFFIFAQSNIKHAQPPPWRKLNHNQLIGDAKLVWKREKPEHSSCVCTDGCNDNCLNRCTYYECDINNCRVGRECGNRQFADLQDRLKSGTKFAEGVEVFLTEDRGYGLKALRSFEPRQIIVEYTGEIITQEESERRLVEVYKDRKNYYLMLFDQNMILDATRGSIARFINHSCQPNCRMEKWLVDGKPRMALFAGEDGVEAGDELTYDYNFTWYKGVDQQSCKCGADVCRGTLGKRTDAPVTKKKTSPTVSKSKPGPGVYKKNSKVTKIAIRKGYKKMYLGKFSKPKKSTPKPGTQNSNSAAILPKAKPGRKPGRKLHTSRLSPPLPPKKSIVPKDPEQPPPVLNSDVDYSDVRMSVRSVLPKLHSTLVILDSDDSDVEISSARKESPKSGCKVLHKIRGKNRVFRTYKINKTIAKMVTGQMEAAATAATAAVRVRGRKPGSGRRAPVHQSKDQNKDDDGGEEMPLVDGNIDDNNVSEDDKTAPISVT